MNASGTSVSPQSAPADRWYVLAVLTAVYAINIADRFVISSLIEPIRTELQLSDGGVAFLTGVALAIFYTTAGIPIAALADRTSRRNILAISIAVWSAMTALCGLSRNYTQLLFCRFGVGIGEAGGTPCSTSILADKFPPAQRPMALSVFALGACLGAWLGSTVAGAVAEQYGWRAAFLVLGVPGIAVAALVWLTVREPRRGQLDASAAPTGQVKVVDAFRFIMTQRSAVHLILAVFAASLWSWGLMWWTPAFLQRSHHLTVGEAGALLGPMHLIAGSGATLLAAWVVGRRGATDPRYVAKLMAWLTAALTIPSIAAYAVDSTWQASLWLWIFVPGIYIYIGPAFGLLQNVVPAEMRATVAAIALFMGNVANLIVAPQVVGWLSDWFAGSFGAGQESLRWALLILAPTGFWGAWHFWASARTLIEDEKRAGTVRS